jgi:isoamylase
MGLLLDGRAQVSGIPRRGSEATLLLIVNAHHDTVLFTLPEVTGGGIGCASWTPTCPKRTRTLKMPCASLSDTATR